FSYREQTVKDEQEGIRSDFWTGDLYKDLKNKGLFPKLTDTVRRAFNIWPMMLTNMNLSPSIRFLRLHWIMLLWLFLVGFTPGPNNPKDLDSFLWPLVEEMLRLPMMWNAAKEEFMTLHAYITLVTADMPGREKLTRMKG
ncbi:hypothetical protein K440DRAFT_513099, partial [Wilcoxina mikolae CBS 423.85]